MPNYPNFVDERINAPVGMRSMCHICPLNGQRKVGHDGPVDAKFIGIFEAPGESEEIDRLTKGVKYGRPLQGKTGYFMRVRHLAAVGLQELIRNPRRPESPLLGALHVHLMNVAMCRPPDNKIESPIGRKAARCCANSARWHVNNILARDPNITLIPAGATALSMLRGEKTSIEPYRGRPTMLATPQLRYEPEAEIEKFVLRGVKPQEEWWEAFALWLKKFILFYRKCGRSLTKQKEKAAQTQFLEQNGWLTDWSKLWKKQKAAATKRAKAAATATVPPSMPESEE